MPIYNHDRSTDQAGLISQTLTEAAHGFVLPTLGSFSQCFLQDETWTAPPPQPPCPAAFPNPRVLPLSTTQSWPPASPTLPFPPPTARLYLLLLGKLFPLPSEDYPPECPQGPEAMADAPAHNTHPVLLHGGLSRAELWSQTIGFKPQLCRFLPGLCGLSTKLLCASVSPCVTQG